MKISKAICLTILLISGSSARAEWHYYLTWGEYSYFTTDMWFTDDDQCSIEFNGGPQAGEVVSWKSTR